MCVYMRCVFVCVHWLQNINIYMRLKYNRYFPFLFSLIYIPFFNTHLNVGSMHCRSSRLRKAWKKPISFWAGISFLGRVYESFVILLRSRHSSPGSHCCHLRIMGPEGPARSRFTPLQTWARWLFDARLIREPEMIGNRLDLGAD